ncbi:MAG: hypothetical protein EPN26_14375, partial [Rhodospirillales bacterium]
MESVIKQAVAGMVNATQLQRNAQQAGGESHGLILDAQPGKAVLVPQGVDLSGADYVRQGPDLVLVQPDGTTILIRDYFAQGDEAPDLLAADGSYIPGDLALKLAGPLAPGEFAQAGNAKAAAQAIGRVDTQAGDVNVVHADGTKGVLHKGDAIYQGDVLQTPKGASVGLVFMDGTTLGLGANGRLVLDQMVYDPSTHTGKSAFSLVQGSFSFVSGQIAKSAPDAATIRTPVATIGIRGTMVAGSFTPDGGLTTALLPEGQSTGEFSITTSAGTTTNNQSFGAVHVSNFFSVPSNVVLVSQGQIANSFREVLNAVSNTNVPSEAKAAADQILMQVFQQSTQDQGTNGQHGTVEDAFKGNTGAQTNVDAKFAEAAQKAILEAVADGKPVEAALLAAMAASQAFKEAKDQGATHEKAMEAAGKIAGDTGILQTDDFKSSHDLKSEINKTDSKESEYVEQAKDNVWLRDETIKVVENIISTEPPETEP